MVRTRADNSAKKAVVAKAPRKVLGSSNNVTPAKVSKYSGGNGVCSQPIPEWQKGIENFIVKSPKPARKETIPSEEGTSDENRNQLKAGTSGWVSAAASTSSPVKSSSKKRSPVKSNSTKSSPVKSNSAKSSPVKKNGIIDDDEDE